MKTYFSFLSVFLFLSGFGQKKKSSYQEREELFQDIYKSLMAESKSIDLKKLEKIVLKNIDEKRLNKDNLVFIIDDLDSKIFAFEVDAFEDIPSIATNPYFNQSTFWTRKNINYLANRLKKNLIPYRGGYQSNFINDSIQLKRLDNKTFAKELSNQKKGKYIQEKEGKISQNEIFYFPYKNKKRLELNSIENDNINYDIINLLFRNLRGKTVSFKIIYNNDRDNAVIKTYQYQNHAWVEIPNKQENKF